MDERLTNIEAQKQAQLQKSDALYNNILNDIGNLYQQQQNYANQYETTQNNALDKQLEFNTNLIEQQKQVARENAHTEQNKARNEYNAFINPYGNQAERLASQGLANSGVSETAALGGYNAYQNRVATANKVMQDAITQYDNDINQARLNNDVAKAQNALEKLKMQLSYSESYYNKKADTMQNQFNTGRNIDTDYYNRYQTEYNNIQNEKARQEAIRQWETEMAEKQRQYNENMAYQKERDRIADEQWLKEYNLSKSKIAASRSGGSGAVSLTGGNQQNNGNYQIVSTDGNGWGKTNLTQKLPDGSSAEVYQNPQGELLYWNPSTNGWLAYGTTAGTSKSNNSNSSLKSNNSNSSVAKYKSTYTPNLSSNEASQWFASNVKPGAITAEELARVISDGENKGKLKYSDREAILKSYGL